jgi:hypothetical protein
MTADVEIPCVGCGGLVPAIEGASHRYMLGSPGCWAAYAEALAGSLRPGAVATPFDALAVDAYAVQHPGHRERVAIQSVWVHLIALHLVLERDWPPAQLVRLRRLGADAAVDWPWLEPPPSMGAVTAIDVVRSGPDRMNDTVRAWVEGAWMAWSGHHASIREQASALVARLG